MWRVWWESFHMWKDVHIQTLHIQRSGCFKRLWMSHVPYEWVMSHMNESWPIWMSHVPYEWVMAHMNESHTPHAVESLKTLTSHFKHSWVTKNTHESLQTLTSHLTLHNVICDLCSVCLYFLFCMWSVCFKRSARERERVCACVCVCNCGWLHTATVGILRV